VSGAPGPGWEPAFDPGEAARAAGLRYGTDATPGILRRRCGRGFTYRGPDGHPPDGRTRARIASLAIPPAWSDVWIAPDPRLHLQATGRDAKGRKQYRYHPRWREVRDADKYARLARFGEGLPDLRAGVEADLARAGHTRDKVLALVIRLLDDTLIRIGNREYAEDNDSYGLTTFERGHVDFGPARVSFTFVGKAGVEHDVTVDDVRLARLVRRCHELGGHRLFAYRGDGGEVVDVTSVDVNRWLQDRTGAPTTAKDFRTWGGTVVATETLGRLGPPTTAREAEANLLEAVDAAAAQLHNTRTVCRTCYVHPEVTAAYRDGRLDAAWRRARSGGRLDRAERATLTVLTDGGDRRPPGRATEGSRTASPG
jgi:DNA topoisomerase I